MPGRGYSPTDSGGTGRQLTSRDPLEVIEGVDDLLGFGASAVVGVDVDPLDGAVGVEDDGGGHRQGVGAVGVDAGQVESEVQLGGAGRGRRAGADAETAGDGVAGVGDD